MKLAIISVAITLDATTVPSRLNAAHVDQIVTGLTTGAASKNVTASDGFSPCWMRARDSGILPHSHTGKKNPVMDNNPLRSSPFFGNLEWIKWWGTNVLTTAANSDPRIMNGNASMNTLKLNVIKSWAAFGSSRLLNNESDKLNTSTVARTAVIGTNFSCSSLCIICIF